MKKLISLILTVALLLTVMPLGAITASAATEGAYKYIVYDGKAMITEVDDSLSGDVEIPSTLGGYPVTSIEKGAFSSNYSYRYSIKSIRIPDSVTNIGDTFMYCQSLTSIEVDENNQYFTSVDGVLFNKDKTVLIQYPVGKKNTSYSIPDSVTSIGDRAFYNCDSLTSIEIPDSVTSIGYSAFSSCSSLTSVDIPNGVTSIGNFAFLGCTGVTKANGVTGECKFTLSDSVLTISGNGKMDDYSNGPGGSTAPWYSFKFNEVIIENGVTNIGSNAFYDCDNLNSVQIPNSVTSIGDYTFSGCKYITSVNLPNSVTSIGSYAFSYCTYLMEIVLGNSVTSIGDNAFYSCDGLTDITIPDSVTSIGRYAFEDCDSLTSVDLGDSVTSISYEAFYSCDSLTSITIPDSVTSIGYNAFSGCNSLKDVWYLGTDNDKEKINISFGNETLLNATWHYICEIQGHNLQNKQITSVCPAVPTIVYKECICGKLFDAEGNEIDAVPTIAGHTGDPCVCGYMTLGWKSDATGWWYKTADGYKANEWFNDNGTWYYFNGSGYMVTGWYSVGGTWYYFNTSGAMATGWVYDGAWYYMSPSGAMVTGWQNIGGTWYYFNAGGAMLTSWHVIGGTWYYFNTSGAMLTGWQVIDGYWYYFYGSGAMAANCWIDGCWLNASGAWVA